MGGSGVQGAVTLSNCKVNRNESKMMNKMAAAFGSSSVESAAVAAINAIFQLQVCACEYVCAWVCACQQQVCLLHTHTHTHFYSSLRASSLGIIAKTSTLLLLSSSLPLSLSPCLFRFCCKLIAQKYAATFSVTFLSLHLVPPLSSLS